MNIGNKDGEWFVRVTHDTECRQEQHCEPNALGWYWCPESEGLSEAVEKLKDCIVKAHEEEIIRLNSSLTKLKELEYGND